MRVLISGSSGLIGTALTEHLTSAGHTVASLVRDGSSAPATSTWDPKAGRLDPHALDGVDAVVNLSGAGIGDHRWTDEYRETLRSSRLQATTLLATAISEHRAPPRVLLNASAIGWYGDRADEELDEMSPRGEGFLPELVRDWEAATKPAEDAGVRVAHLRSGIVLSADGGALAKMLPLFRLGVGGPFGRGRQWMSWISLTDEVRAITHLLDSPLSGAVNLTAPNPVRNRDFARALGRALHRPALIPVPAFGPKLLLGSDRIEALLFDSQRVVRSRLSTVGFEFEDADVDTALGRILDEER